LGFERHVPSGGYVWWYVDALSDDGAYGITLIAFIGSVFSPYYAWSRRRGGGDPLQHCALNVALYGGVKGWAMTERGSAHIQRSQNDLTIGPSRLAWDGSALEIDIIERTMPWAGHIRGQVRVRPEAMTGRSFALDAAGQHRWSPLAPRAQVEVILQRPEVSWKGVGYFDSNDGDVPLEQSFASWTWSRAPIEGGTAILYDVTPHSGTGASLALRINRTGSVTDFAAPPLATLPKTRWRVPRATRADGGHASVRQTLEDTPFYARSVLNSRLLGQEVTALHESLSLQRFRSPVVQAMLPFRMPRAG
jgi:carotenoid 1,2-hydratase